MACSWSPRSFLARNAPTYFEFLGQELTCEQCVELGLINEVVPRDQLVARAKEIAKGMDAV